MIEWWVQRDVTVKALSFATIRRAPVGDNYISLIALAVVRTYGLSCLWTVNMYNNLDGL